MARARRAKSLTPGGIMPPPTQAQMEPPGGDLMRAAADDDPFEVAGGLSSTNPFAPSNGAPKKNGTAEPEDWLPLLSTQRDY